MSRMRSLTVSAHVGRSLYCPHMPYTQVQRRCLLLYSSSMTGYTYILRCADGTFYAGSTKHLDDRFAAHQLGLGSDYTSNRRPVELVWWCELDGIDEAFALEKQIQGWSHTKRRAFIEGGFDAIRGWSSRERALRSRE